MVRQGGAGHAAAQHPVHGPGERRGLIAHVGTSVNMDTVLRSPVLTMRGTASFLKSPSSQLQKKVMGNGNENVTYSQIIIFFNIFFQKTTQKRQYQLVAQPLATLCQMFSV